MHTLCSLYALRFLSPRLLPLCALAAMCLATPTRAQQPPPVPAKPTLYVLAVGVSHYLDPGIDLEFPVKDATDVAARFQAQQGELFGRVVVTTLTGKEATRRGIINSLVRLQRQAPQMRPNDCVILFAAGLGGSDEPGQYYFAPSDADLLNWDVTAVDWVSASRFLAHLPCHVLVLLDARQAGGATGPPNAAVFASCGAGERTYESRAWDGGAFAKALLDGTSGLADGDHDGTVTLEELASYICRRVSDLTKNAQHPVLVRPAAFPADLPLAVVSPAHGPPGQPPSPARPAK